MKKVLVLAAVLCHLQVFARGVQVTASEGDPIPVAFTAGDASSALFDCSGNVVEVLNQTAEVLAIGFGSSASSAAQTDFLFIPAGPKSGNSIRLNQSLREYIYLRSAGAEITSGSVQVSCFQGAQ